MSKGTVYTQQLKLRQKVAPKVKIAPQKQSAMDRRLPKVQAKQERKAEVAKKNLAQASRPMATYADEKYFYTAGGTAIPRMTAAYMNGVDKYAKEMSELYGETITPDMVRGQTSYAPSGQKLQNAPRDSANNALQIKNAQRDIANNSRTPEELMKGMQDNVFSGEGVNHVPSGPDLFKLMPQGSLPQDKIIEDLIANGFYGEAVKVRQGSLGVDDPMVQRMRGTTKKDVLRPQVQSNPYASQSYSPATGSSLSGATAQFGNSIINPSRAVAAAASATRQKTLGQVTQGLQEIGAIPGSGTSGMSIPDMGYFDPQNPTSPYAGYLAQQNNAQSYNKQQPEAWASYGSPTIDSRQGGSYGDYVWKSDSVPQAAQQQYSQDYGLLEAMRNQFSTAQQADRARDEAAMNSLKLQGEQDSAALEKGFTDKMAQLKQSWAKRGIMDSSYAIEGEKEVLLEIQNAQERLKANLAEQLTQLASEGAMSQADAELAFQKLQYELMQDSQATSMKMQELRQSQQEAQRKGDLDLMKFYQTERQNVVEAQYKKIMEEQIMGNLTGKLSNGMQTKESSRAGAERNIAYAEYMGYQYDPYTGTIKTDSRGNPLMNQQKLKSSGGGGGSSTGSSNVGSFISFMEAQGLTPDEIYSEADKTMKPAIIAYYQKPSSSYSSGLGATAGINASLNFISPTQTTRKY